MEESFKFCVVIKDDHPSILTTPKYQKQSTESKKFVFSSFQFNFQKVLYCGISFMK